MEETGFSKAFWELFRVLLELSNIDEKVDFLANPPDQFEHFK
jgi:hypothetical protein